LNFNVDNVFVFLGNIVVNEDVQLSNNVVVRVL